MARNVVLYGPAVDRFGNYCDAGSVLSVGAEDNDDTDLTTAQADALEAGLRGVPTAKAIEDGALDPVDAPPESDGLDEKTIAELREIAAAEDIDLGSLTLKAAIIDAIREGRA
jgi:hypothetical protein